MACDITADWFVSADRTNIQELVTCFETSFVYPSKYNDLMAIVRAAISLSRRQTDIERAFSLSPPR